MRRFLLPVAAVAILCVIPIRWLWMSAHLCSPLASARNSAFGSVLYPLDQANEIDLTKMVPLEDIRISEVNFSPDNRHSYSRGKIFPILPYGHIGDDRAVRRRFSGRLNIHSDSGEPFLSEDGLSAATFAIILKCDIPNEISCWRLTAIKKNECDHRGDKKFINKSNLYIPCIYVSSDLRLSNTPRFFDGVSSDGGLPYIDSPLKNGHETQTPGQPQEHPIVRRLLLLFIGGLGGFGCTVAGVEQLDHNRRRGSALIILGSACAAFVWVLWWIDFAFPSSWSWPI